MHCLDVEEIDCLGRYNVMDFSDAYMDCLDLDICGNMSRKDTCGPHGLLENVLTWLS
jgi:hypothetical protein